MSKSTIIDVARSAGMSTATVDRALNGRAGVSAANRQRVLQAARDLGYLPFAGMVPLPARPVHLEFFIPFLQSGFMGELAQGIRDFARSVPLVASCNIRALENFGPDALLKALEVLSAKTSGVGLVTSDHPKTREAIIGICEAGVRVVTIATDLPGTPRSAYIGVDNVVAGRTAALLMGKMVPLKRGSIVLFLGSRAYNGHQGREQGFRMILEKNFPDLTLLPAVETAEDNNRSRAAMTSLLRSNQNLAGVYCVGAGRTGIVEALQEISPDRRPLIVMHDLTDSTRTWLANEQIDVIIDQNARLVGEQAVIRLLGAIATSTPLLAVKDIEPRILLRENIPLR